MEGDKLQAIRVVVRVRPFLGDEAQRHKRCVLPDSANASVTVKRGDTGTGRAFTFDRVLDEQSTQAEAHEAIQLDRLVTGVLSGYNGTIFAYGPTGSGKTHTMEGFMYQDTSSGPSATVSESAEGHSGRYGVIPTICAMLFDEVRARQADGQEVSVSATYVQIYREQVYDLLTAPLGPGPPQAGPQAAFGRVKAGQRTGGLRLRWLPGRGFYLEDVTMVTCNSADDCLAMFRTGVKNKVMAGHRLNHASSRSHALFTLNIEIKGAAQGVLRSKLTLVDLAGSERSSMTGNTGVRLAESLFINKSLFTLRKVISVLADAAREHVSEKSIFVPYRDSKLTSLLQHSLGGSSITVCIACISPGDHAWEETVSTLEYASMTRTITNRVNVNEDPMAKEIRELRQQVQFLHKQLAASGGTVLQAPGDGQGPHWTASQMALTPAAVVPMEDIVIQPGALAFLQRLKEIAEELSTARVLTAVPVAAASAAQSAEREGEEEGEDPPPAPQPPPLEVQDRPLLNSETREGLLTSIADLDAFVEASNRLRSHAASLMQTSSIQRDENQRLLSENAELRDTLSFFEELVAIDDAEGSGEQQPVSAPSFDARGSQALSRDGLATPGESSGARELHTANRAVLMELLSLRQENASMRERLTAAEAQLSAAPGGGRLAHARSVTTSGMRGGNAGKTAGRGGGRGGGYDAGDPFANGDVGGSSVVPVMLSTTGRLLGAGMLDQDSIASMMISRQTPGFNDAAVTGVVSDYGGGLDSNDSTTHLQKLLRERMALSRGGS